MTDIILGMGEVGETLFNLLEDRKFDCVGIDIDSSKCKKISEKDDIEEFRLQPSACLTSLPPPAGSARFHFGGRA